MIVDNYEECENGDFVGKDDEQVNFSYKKVPRIWEQLTISHKVAAWSIVSIMVVFLFTPLFIGQKIAQDFTEQIFL